MQYVPDHKWYFTAGILAIAALGITTLGWLFGPPPAPSKKRQHSPGINEERENEKKVQILVASLNKSMDALNFTEAEKYAQEVLSFTEQVWGKNHPNYGLVLGAPVANLYEKQKNYVKMVDALETSGSVLGVEMLYDLGILDKLIRCLPYTGNYTKAEVYAKQSLKINNEALLKNKNDPRFFERYTESVLNVALFYSDAGLFKKAEVLFQEIIETNLKQDRTSDNIFFAIEHYTNALHQQGNTEEALKKLDEYRKFYKGYQGLEEMVIKLLQRAITLCFAMDDYKKCYEYIQQILNFTQHLNTAPTLQTIMDFATVFRELGKPEDAEKLISQIQTGPLGHPGSPPLVRSRYLSTINCQLTSGVYKLTLRVNRLRPQRKEGDRLEEKENIRRKLDQCFLVVSFQNTKYNEPPVIVEHQVKTPHEILIESPQMEPEHKPKTWYRINITIFANEKKGQELGTHVQLVFLNDF